MAHKKGVGSSKNGRESESKRLGVKIFGGQKAIAGNIIVRQRGTQHHPGENVGIGKDHTVLSISEKELVISLLFRLFRTQKTKATLNHIKVPNLPAANRDFLR